MNETTFKFTSEEKEQTLQILERLRTAVGDTFKPGDEQHLREDIQHAFINHQIKRNVFGMNPILSLQCESHLVQSYIVRCWIPTSSAQSLS